MVLSFYWRQRLRFSDRFCASQFLTGHVFYSNDILFIRRTLLFLVFSLSVAFTFTTFVNNAKISPTRPFCSSVAAVLGVVIYFETDVGILFKIHLFALNRTHNIFVTDLNWIGTLTLILICDWSLGHSCSHCSSAIFWTKKKVMLLALYSTCPTYIRNGSSTIYS